jgi:hypothetical protein
MITQAELKQILHYDPETGIFRWRYSVAQRVKPWDVAGSKDKKGYMITTIKCKAVTLHRLAWLYMTGVWPKNQIDHIDGVQSNNSWNNLREATAKQNRENLCLAKNNTSGFRGVSFAADRKKWIAQVKHNGTQLNLGYFDTVEEAAQAAAAKRAELFTHDTGRDQVNTFG